ncbi:MAG TPA: YlxR family protein, partial [Anaerolineae bacterium]|nr:YlxR family protein [Anaerolineae bacterium]
MVKGSGRRKRIPQRTCVACRQVQGKRALVRIVRLAGGDVQVDPTGKLAGRGAYLCSNQE